MNAGEANRRGRLGLAVMGLGAAFLIGRSIYVDLGHPGAIGIVVVIGAAIVGIGFALIWTARRPS